MASKLVKWVLGRLRDDISLPKNDGINKKILNISAHQSDKKMEENGRQPDQLLFTISGVPNANNPESAFVEASISRNSQSLLDNPKIYKTLIFLLLAILKVVIVVLAIVTHLNAENEKSATLCTSEECLRSAANLKLALDPSLDPCDDFYKYTCARWSAENPNHGWFTWYSSFKRIEERILFDIEYFLKSEVREDEPKPAKQARDFYKSCMDPEPMDGIGLMPIIRYLKKVGLPLVPSYLVKSQEEQERFKFDSLRSDAVTKKIFGMDVLVGLKIDVNPFNSSENVMYIGRPTQECRLPSIPRYQVDKNLMKHVLNDVINFVNYPKPDAELIEKAVGVLVEMTTDIDKIIAKYPTDSGLPRAENIKLYQNHTNEILLNDINRTYPRAIEMYLEYLFENRSVTVDFDKDLIYFQENNNDYIPKILSYVLKTSDVRMELFMWWKIVLAMIVNTSSDPTKYVKMQKDDKQSELSHSLKCAKLVNEFMPMAVTYGIVDRAVTDTTKRKVDEMVDNIKEDFVEQVASLSWMDDASKNATQEKSKEMLSLIGYPDWLFTNGSLERYYEGVDVHRYFVIVNLMTFIQRYMSGQLESLRKTNERNLTEKPTVVNAFYYPQENAMLIPLAILYFPMYHLGLEVLNYGAMGSVLGHELTHGFDKNGRLFDKYGNYKQWWTNDTIEAFKEKSQCFAKQYENITTEGVKKHVKGNATLGEILADNGGMNQAYRAYKKLQRRYGPEAKLPGFENFTHDQLFFIAYGSIWCETVSTEGLELLIDCDEHPPSSVRVLGAVQNSPYFAEAFNCPLGSKMNPKNKCQVW